MNFRLATTLVIGALIARETKGVFSVKNDIKIKAGP